ncbi:hypothetical protein KO525_16975 [Psychrosphaera sp. B3R10]|uniref:hypothetical protein n=1 Tax=unclassified Psychrosphaera TaxID=2641570 RepID=UPI001C0A6591|nr:MULTISPECIES: hypothetical protein [unclassified Psychrosphaera]MBU2881666.1 hypothetical protein [Psychrosphaera sp. I2R16]MBU2991079.1 hypothetical protein [Psychrosphaera sp. B3R10]
MTRLSAPDVIACPYCGQKHERSRLASFSNLWSVEYSDGGSTFAPYDCGVVIGRCTVCDVLIPNVGGLKSLGEVVTIKRVYPSFWRSLFGLDLVFDVEKPFQLPELPLPELPDWFEAATITTASLIPVPLQRQCQLIAMHKYNQLLVAKRRWQHQDFIWKVQYRAKHQEIENQILLRFNRQSNKASNCNLVKGGDDSFEFDAMVAADIYRRRGLFDSAKRCLEKVTDDSYQYRKTLLMQWILDKNRHLMIVPNQRLCD